MKYEQIKNKISRLWTRIRKLKIELAKKQNSIIKPDTANPVFKNIVTLYDSDWNEYTSLPFSGDHLYALETNFSPLTFWQYVKGV